MVFDWLRRLFIRSEQRTIRQKRRKRRKRKVPKVNWGNILRTEIGVYSADDADADTRTWYKVKSGKVKKRVLKNRRFDGSNLDLVELRPLTDVAIVKIISRHGARFGSFSSIKVKLVKKIKGRKKVIKCFC